MRFWHPQALFLPWDIWGMGKILIPYLILISFENILKSFISIWTDIYILMYGTCLLCVSNTEIKSISVSIRQFLKILWHGQSSSAIDTECDIVSLRSYKKSYFCWWMDFKESLLWWSVAGFSSWSSGNSGKLVHCWLPGSGITLEYQKYCSYWFSFPLILP